MENNNPMGGVFGFGRFKEISKQDQKTPAEMLKPEDGSHPDVPPVEPKIRVEETIRMIEADLDGEIKAIAAYQAHIDAIPYEQVKSVLEHIKKEEEQHATELKGLITLIQVKGVTKEKQA